MSRLSELIRRRLRLRVVVWLLVIPVPPLLLTIWAAQDSYSRLASERQQAAHELALQTLQTLDRLLFERYGDAQIFSQLPVVRALELNRIAEVAKAVVTTYAPYYVLIVMADRDGVIRAVNQVDGNGRPIPSRRLIGATVRSESWFTQALAGQQVHVEDVHADGLTRQVFGEDAPRTVTFSSRIMGSEAGGREGQVVGVWAAWIPEPVFIQALGLGRNGVEGDEALRVALFTKGGQEIGVGAKGAGQPEAKTLGGKGGTVKIVVTPLASVASTGFASYSGLGWTVRVYPGSGGQTARTPFSLPIAGGIGVSILAGMLFIWRLTTRQLVEPLEALADAAEALKRGEATEIPRDPDRRDAIGVLQSEVSGMVTALRSQQEMLRTHAVASMDQAVSLQLLLENIRDITTAESDLDQYLQKLTESACRLVGAKYGALGVFDGEGKRLAQFFTVGLDEATRKAIGELPTGLGLLGALVHETRPMRLKDLTHHPASVGFPPHHPPMHSFLGASIRAHGRLFGRLYLTEKRDADEFTEGDALTIDAIAAQAGVAIENAHLLRDAQRREEALRMSNQELENFTYAVSHDLQTPLRGIHGFADLLLKRIKDRLEPRELHYVDRIQAGARRMAEMVNDLLEFSRIERITHPFEDVALDDVLAQSLADLQGVIRKAHAGVVIEKPLPVVWADRVRMGQVWTNLLTNAIKYAKAGVAPKIVVRWSETPQEFVFMVQDNGIGIAPEFHARIFGLFHRLHTDEAYEGTGVGLAIVKRIVEFHKGRIRVESAEGHGSTFVFTIPKKTVSV